MKELFLSLLEHQIYVMGATESGESIALTMQSTTSHNTAATISKTVTANDVNQLQFTVSPVHNYSRKKSKSKGPRGFEFS